MRSGSASALTRLSPGSRPSTPTNDPRNIVKPKGPIQMLRKRIWITLDDPGSSSLARYLSSAVIVVITISILNFAVGSIDTYCRWSPSFELESTVFKCRGERYEDHDGTKWVETVCIIIFTAEYVLRVLCCGTAMPLWRFLFDPLNLLDLLAIMPWYVTRIVEAVMSGSNIGEVQNVLGVLRIVRLTRILRVFKASKSMKMMLVLGRTLSRSTSILTILLFSSVCMMVLFGALIVMTDEGVYNVHTMQYVRPSGEPSPFYSIGNAMYWCMTTMTTVGYGDYYPETPAGTAVGIVCMLSGVVILSLPITVISRTFTEEFEEQNRINRREALLAGLHRPGDVEATRPSIRTRLTGGLTSTRLSAARSVRRSCGSSSGGSSVAAAASPSTPQLPLAEGSEVAADDSCREASLEDLDSSRNRNSTRKSRTDIIRKATLVREHADAVVVPGYLQCKWLLSDFSDNVANEFQITLRKGEADLLRMSRQVLVRSRILADGPARSTSPELSPRPRAPSPSEEGGWQRDRAPAPYAPAPEGSVPDPAAGSGQLNYATSHY